MTIKWQQEYELGIHSIDEQHQEFIQIFNRLSDTFLDRDQDKVRMVVNDLVAYGKKHFEYEEDLLKKFACFGYEEHIEEHRKLTADLDKFVKRSETEDESLKFEIFEFMEHWLREHTQKYDRDYVGCFHENGVE